MLIPVEKMESRLPQARHAIGFFFLLVAVILLVGALIGLGLSRLGIRIQDLSAQTRTIFEVMIQASLTVALIWAFLQLGRFDTKATLSLRPSRPRIYAWALVTSISLGFVVSQLTSYLVQVAPWLLSESLVDMVRQSRFGDPVIYALYATAISIGPGLTEELAFRGFILRGLSARMGSVGAVTLTALLFALLHIDPLWILGVFPFGLLAGYLVVRSGSLYPAVAVHVLNNLWSTVEGSVMQAYNPGSNLKELLMDWGYPSIVTLAAAVLLIVGLYALHRSTRQQNANALDSARH